MDAYGKTLPNRTLPTVTRHRAEMAGFLCAAAVFAAGVRVASEVAAPTLARIADLGHGQAVALGMVALAVAAIGLRAR